MNANAPARTVCATASYRPTVKHKIERKVCYSNNTQGY